MRSAHLVGAVLAFAIPAPLHAQGEAVEGVVANDNRIVAGQLRGGVLEVGLEARAGAWRPDAGVDTSVTVLGFAEEAGPVTIPGPLLRVPQGTEVRVSVRNLAPASIRLGGPPQDGGAGASGDRVLVVHGLRAGMVPEDTVHVAPGSTREVRYRADRPGTYLYWGAIGDTPLTARTGRDSQLAGAIVVDPAGSPPDPAERIFVMTMLDVPPDSTKPPPHEDIFEIAINGLSWPHTERLHYEVGDTVRWRWVNGTDRSHPMHLHGFHFRRLAKGVGGEHTTYGADSASHAVTEFMPAGSTFRMEWVPTRVGNWLMHCHMVAHVTPYPRRTAEAQAHDVHDVAQHVLQGMAGLVLGIEVAAGAGEAAEATVPESRRRLRLLAQQRRITGSDLVARGFVLQAGDEPASDSMVVPGPPLVLTRGEPTAITVVNRLDEPTTVHWHGMELESVYDGVAGWSGAGSRIAPLLAPGDSFTVHLTPPRAGTFIYHTHMDESAQLPAGMYGPLLVLEPGERFDPERDRIFIVGPAADSAGRGPRINGTREPAPLTVTAGVEYRLRLIHILPNAPARFTLERDSVPLRWRPLAKDGAELPLALRGEGVARVRMGVGEAYDFAWTPSHPGEAELLVRLGPRVPPLRQPIRVR